MSSVLTTLDHVRAMDVVLIAHQRPDLTIEAVVDHDDEEHLLFYEPELSNGAVVQNLSFNKEPVMFRYDSKLGVHFETKLAQKQYKDE
jgi:hypothetical protein